MFPAGYRSPPCCRSPPAPWRFGGGNLGTHLAGWAGFLPGRLYVLWARLGSAWVESTKGFIVGWLGFFSKFFFGSSWELPAFPWAELFSRGCLHAAWLVHRADKEEFQVLISLTAPSVWKAAVFSANTTAVTDVVLSSALKFSAFEGKEVTLQDLLFFFWMIAWQGLRAFAQRSRVSNIGWVFFSLCEYNLVQHNNVCVSLVISKV